MSRSQSRFILALGIAILSLGRVELANAQVTDHATCGTTLPACTALRTNCCTRDFPGASTQKAIIIPLDRCHQRITQTGALGPPGGPTGDATAPNWCADPPNNDLNSMFMAYGLVYRLMQAGIPVYWIVNPTKAPTKVTITSDTQTHKDVDFWVLAPGLTDAPAPTAGLTAVGATPPVRLLATDAGLNLVASTAYSKNEFPLRGSAFLIAPEHRAAFDTFWKKRRNGTCGQQGTDCYDFRTVKMYEVDPSATFVWQDFIQATVNGRPPIYKSQVPVAMKVDYAPPKVARITAGNAMINWLASANLDDPATNTISCKTGAAFVPADAISCDLDEADVLLDRLQNFNWAWFNINSNSCGPTAAKLKTFVTAIDGSRTAGNVMFSDSGITVAECPGAALLGVAATGLALQNTGVNETANQPIIIRYPNNLFSQYGDLPLDFAPGTVSYWKRVSGGASLYAASYDTVPSTLKRLASRENTSANNPTCANHDDTHVFGASSPAGCDDGRVAANADIDDAFTYARYANHPENGIIFYSPGQNLSQNNQSAQLKMVLSSLIATPPFTVEQVFDKFEVSRGQPVVAIVDNKESLVQGTYEVGFLTRNGVQFQVPRTVPGVYTKDDLAQFTFPGVLGHLRAVTTASVSTNAQNLSSGTVLFDAATNIPPVTTSGCSPAYQGTCRTVFTTLAGGRNPDNIQINTTNVATLGPKMLDATFTTAEQTTFIERILRGYDDGTNTGLKAALGGVDRSSVAVIGPGASVGGARPTVAYFGATDGMLHAVCASVTGACTSLGRELWAFVPRVNLSTLRYNSARIDGSPRVLDLRGDFYGTGATVRTVLLFQTGSGDPTKPDATPAVYALDVTDPTTPRVLWEYTTNTTRGTIDLGVGLTIAAGEATVNNVKRNMVIVQTNNGGTDGAGSVITALDADNGTVLWQKGHLYPAARTAGNAAVPATGIPGGATTIDKTESGTNAFMTDIVVGDLYGRLWVLDPSTGESRYKQGTVDIPLFSFATDFHPIGARPAIYSNGNQLFAAFATGGYSDTSASVSWGTYTTTQYAISVGLNTPTDGTNPTLPMSELTTNATYMPIKLTLTGGERVHSQLRVIGNEVFLTSDTQLVNANTFGTSTANTGKVYRIGMGNGSSQVTTASTFVVAQGASSLASSGTRLFSSSGSKRQEVGGSATSTTGNRVNPTVQQSSSKRKLWMRVE